MSEVCALFSPECHGRLEWHHAVKQQRLKREFKYGASRRLASPRQPWVPTSRYSTVDAAHKSLSDILGDERNRVWLCSHHHELVTNGRLEAPLPQSVWDFAKEFGLTAMVENDLARRAA